MSKLVSLLVPTRGRVTRLANSLISLEQTVFDPSRVEVLVRADDDDIDTRYFLEHNQWQFEVKSFFGPRGNGYADLHLMYGELCKESTGRFLFLWNDDANMLTRDWDSCIATKDDGKLKFLRSDVSDTRGRDHDLFPIVHRSYYDTLGHYSLSAHNDTYIRAVFEPLPEAVDYVPITVQHSALELIAQGDKTSIDAKQCWPTTKGLWGSPEVQNGLKADVAKLRELLKQQALAG